VTEVAAKKPQPAGNKIKVSFASMVKKP